ncbi:Tetraspanin-6 [Oopsacas minuta]|uniref:Tetraspanin-6 n=1 Tax=Oopsacas minuta TaxID=111878 RepID=A0AAV7JK92_9METZ|nr:Tetraspanin-6 [Oopsacas minuta]
MAESRHVKRFRTIFALLQLFLLVPAALLLIIVLILFEIPTTFEPIISRYTYFFSAYIVIPSNLLAFPLAIFGALVSIRHKIPAVLTTLYIVLLSLLFIGQMTGSCLGFLNYGILRELIGQNFQNSILDYNLSNLTRNAIDSTQIDLKCCGGVNFTDWNAYITNNSYPTSCCHSSHENATCTIQNNSTNLTTISNETILFLNELPCANAIAQSVIGQTYSVGYVGLLSLTIPGILIVITFCLININLSLD